MAFKDTLIKLKDHLPELIYNQLDNVLVFGIDGPKRMSHLLGQAYHESGGFRTFQENLNYSAQGLLNTFPKYFKTKEIAEQYARNPEKIANRVYANRMGNGDEASGDGWKHRGFGALQTTGTDNQQEFFEFKGLPKNTEPSKIATDYPLESAAYFFKKNNLWSICDQGVDDATITKLRKRVNGGILGLTEVAKHTKEFYKILTS